MRKPELPREVMYAVGQLHEYVDRSGPPWSHYIVEDTWVGPVPSEEVMLEVVGRDNKSVIVRYNADGTEEVIWRWRDDRWIANEERSRKS